MPALREPGARYAPPRVSTLGLRALALIATSIGLLVVDYRHHELAWIRASLTTVAWPLQSAVHFPSAAWSWLTDAGATRAQLRKENEELKLTARNNQLRLLRLEAVQRENVRLLGLLNATPRDTEKSQVATILRVDLDPLRHRVLIDRGARDGVTRGQPVIDAHGIFGQVTNVSPIGAEIILLSDPSHAIPVQIERNGLRTIAVGTGDALRLSLPYLPRNADIKVDDHLVSSGLDGIFPEGYPVARILEVKRDPSQPLASVVAEPTAALDRDTEVMLIWLHQRVSATEALASQALAAPRDTDAPRTSAAR